MPTFQHKNTKISNQDNIAETVDKDFKTAIRNIFKNLKEGKNRSFNESHENKTVE